MSDASTTKPLRVVTFNVLPPAFQVVAHWAEAHGHKLLLVVTTPGPSTRRTPTYRDVVALAPPGVDVLVTTRLRRVATPLIRALQPDLVVSATFPYRIPPEIVAIPRFGAVNLHPAALPAYRGPNVARAIYEGRPTLGATLHRTAEEYDTGAILSQYTAPLPDELTEENVWATWMPLIERAFVDGVERAVAGDPGVPQDDEQASYAAAFSEAEHWLDWDQPARTLQCQAVALNLFGTRAARCWIDGVPWVVERIEPLADGHTAAPGTVLARGDGELQIAVADGAVRVTAAPLPG